MTLEDARRAIAAGERQATELKVPYNIAVVDAGGNLIAHARIDGAWLGSIDIAIDKAWTASAFQMTTDSLSCGSVEQDVQVARAAVAGLWWWAMVSTELRSGPRPFITSGMWEWLLFVPHLFVTIVKIVTPGSACSEVAESLIPKHQLR